MTIEFFVHQEWVSQSKFYKDLMVILKETENNEHCKITEKYPSSSVQEFNKIDSFKGNKLIPTDDRRKYSNTVIKKIITKDECRNEKGKFYCKYLYYF